MSRFARYCTEKTVCVESEDGKEVLGRREECGVDWVRNGEVENARRMGIQFLSVA